MSNISSFTIRRIASSIRSGAAAARASQTRCLSGSTVPADIEHFTSGWNIEDIAEFSQPGSWQVQTFNKISEKGLAKFPSELYGIKDTNSGNAHAILLRSHKLQEEEVDVCVRAIARCGAGTNNVPVARMTELGIPVFNTPGANANAVKELILCGMLLGSRRIVDGINHMKELGSNGVAKERVEKDKAMFGGQELKGKTLAVIGLGHIGAATAKDGATLGMNVTGYDPGLSVNSALKLPKKISLCDSIASAVSSADYISINIPYIKGEGGTHGVIGKDVISNFKCGAVLLNFARGELVDSDAMKAHLDNNGRYISDFPDDTLWDHKNSVILPHLGASTEEAEDSAAGMAAETIREYLETGSIRNSVNFPSVSLPDRPDGSIRISVVNKNQPGVLAQITDSFAKHSMNIVRQINNSKGDVAYNVLDIEPGNKMALKDLQKDLTMTEGVLSSRVVFGTPGAGYARNIEGEFWV